MDLVNVPLIVGDGNFVVWIVEVVGVGSVSGLLQIVGGVQLGANRLLQHSIVTYSNDYFAVTLR